MMYNEGLMIPIFGIFMIIAIVIGPIWIRSYYREKERAQLHETLRTAYEKGQPPPPELIERLTGGGDDQSLRRVGTASESDLRRAIVLISVGIGLGMLGLGLGYGISLADSVGGWITGAAIAGSGAIPGMIGLAYLFLWLGKRHSGPSA
ncbi:MAG TPA: DUF6249 domain-containing protein [Caulobacteraceae bacterium]|nr:DUF6249 domain-containing protein [Caulobacteraceae bacterium]